MTAAHHSIITGAKVPDKAAFFNCSNSQQAYFSTPSINNSSPLTFGGWFKFYRACQYVGTICGWNQSGGWGSTHILLNSVRFGIGNSSGMHGLTNGLPQNIWMHLIATYDGTNIILYKDGTVYQQWNVGSQTRANNESVFRVAGLNEGSMKYSSVAACNVFAALKSISASDVTALYKAPYLNKVSYLSGQDVFGAYNLTEQESQSSFPSAIGGSAMSIGNGFSWVDSPFV